MLRIYHNVGFTCVYGCGCMYAGVFTIIYSADTYAGEDVIFSFCTIPLVDSETRRNSEGKRLPTTARGWGGENLHTYNIGHILILLLVLIANHVIALWRVTMKVE